MLEDLLPPICTRYYFFYQYQFGLLLLNTCFFFSLEESQRTLIVNYNFVMIFLHHICIILTDINDYSCHKISMNMRGYGKGSNPNDHPLPAPNYRYKVHNN
jgi:hypothetical protein